MSLIASSNAMIEGNYLRKYFSREFLGKIFAPSGIDIGINQLVLSGQTYPLKAKGFPPFYYICNMQYRRQSCLPQYYS